MGSGSGPVELWNEHSLQSGQQGEPSDDGDQDWPAELPAVVDADDPKTGHKQERPVEVDQGSVDIRPDLKMNRLGEAEGDQ